MSALGTIREPARETPVYRRCNVLVVGGGPAGCAAAAAAAQVGADTVLVERYGHLGGLSTGGLVVWIDRMTDWTGRQVITGFADDVLDRIPGTAVLGPSDDLWGSKDARIVEYWRDRHSAHNGVVTWAPTVDPEMLKIAYLDAVLARGVKLLLHAWAVAPVQEENRLRGIVFESKEGRRAILADVVVDATGDGDVFALAGASFDSDIVENDIHHRISVACRWGGVDTERYLRFRNERNVEFRGVMEQGRAIGVTERPHIMPRNDVCLFMGPRLAGYSCLSVEDLTEVEIDIRRRQLVMLGFYRKNMPGFADAWLMDTAPQIGTRHSRRLAGVKRITREEWMAGKVHEDEVAVSPSPKPQFPSVSVPLGALIPVHLENLLAAGRNLSSDAVSHTFMREVPQCWQLGQAAGVAAAVAADAGSRVRDVNVADVRTQLAKQGVYLQEASAHESQVGASAERFRGYGQYTGPADARKGASLDGLRHP